MKIYIALFILLSYAFACSSKNGDTNNPESSKEQNAQQWNLVKMSVGMTGSVSTGEQMAWQETYVFKGDGSFTKKRVQNGSTTTASGTYNTVEENNEKGLKLKYAEPSSIIGNCTGNQEEYLYYKESGTILQSSWLACDGPGLFYERN